jgi:preprotein translocase SecE subunit
VPREPRRRSGTEPAATAPAASLPRPRAHENLPRPAAAPAAPGGAGPVIRRRRNPLRFLGRFEPRFIADIISELRKVTWPTFAETRYLTFVVAIVAVSVGILLGGVDFFFGWIIEKIFFN